MPGTRDHEPLIIEDFQGLWKRGDDESAPSDHFIQCDNIQFFHSGFESRDGLEPYLTAPFPGVKLLRIYNYVTQGGQTILALDNVGNIYHVTSPSTPLTTPILHVTNMEDFGFVAISGRAYITPFRSYLNAQGEKYQLGIQNEFLYVYKGDGTPARKAAGNPPTASPMTMATTGTTGSLVRNDGGFHLFAVVYETDTGFLTSLGPLPRYTGPPTPPNSFNMGLVLDPSLQIQFNNIPVSPDSFVKRRHLLATKEILDFNGDQNGYQFFFIPGGTINDNITTSFAIDTMFDSDLISDASHLIDNFAQIPSGVALNTYHSRLIIVGEFGTTETLTGLPPGITDNRSLARVSFPGEPESISKIDGLIIAPLDGKALTNVQEFRDVLYLFKNTRTFAYSDNFDVPASWQEEVIDQGVGVPVHGIATVLDTGGVNIDFLFLVDWSGLMLFNGTYAQPELTWKIEDYWRGLSRNDFHCIQIVNDSLNKHIWITLPPPNRKFVLHADYANGMNAKDIRWTIWVFDTQVTTAALINTDRLVLGALGPV